jgi:hypothetical protein
LKTADGEENNVKSGQRVCSKKPIDEHFKLVALICSLSGTDGPDATSDLEVGCLLEDFPGRRVSY